MFCRARIRASGALALLAGAGLWLQASTAQASASALLPVPSASPSASASARPSPVAEASAAPSAPLAVDGHLRRNVEFWTSIYTRYTTRQGLVHDAKYIDIVYEVVDFDRSPLSPARQVREAKRRARATLLSLHRKRHRPSEWSGEERRVARLFDGIDDPLRFRAAAESRRLRFQLGQKDRFAEGIRQSGLYLAAMEEIFRREGLPVELTRLPFVESSFNLRARSKAGASGIWQFMRSTGRLFLRIDAAVDERNDPIRATEAAARLLRGNYDALGSWPLAVTAYNHGRQGMARAVRKVGSDELERVVASYRSRSFGFASSNFFTELLAAIEAERNSERYFGRIERARPLRFTEVAVPDYIEFQELCRFLRLEPGVLRDLNPALSEAVFRGELRVPSGYRLRLPADPSLTPEAQVRVFLAGYAQIPGIYKEKAQKRVRYGRKRSNHKSF